MNWGHLFGPEVQKGMVLIIQTHGLYSLKKLYGWLNKCRGQYTEYRQYSMNNILLYTIVLV